MSLQRCSYPLTTGLIDIGINLTDAMFEGYYNGHNTPTHVSDLDLVVDRAVQAGISALIITGSSLSESKKAVAIAMSQNTRLFLKNSKCKCYATVGCHPCHSSEMKDNVPDYIEGLRAVIRNHSVRLKPESPEGVVVAIGEMGLDYDRLHYATKEHQKIGFEAQFALVEEFQLPLFLHNRNTDGDFTAIMKAHANLFEKSGGVCHSFTSDQGELDDMLNLGLYIGINGCSLKTQENLEVVKKIPLDKMLIESDGPWCEIRNTHASSSFLKGSDAETYLKAIPHVKKEKFSPGCFVKSRNEPSKIIEVFEVLYRLRSCDVDSKEGLAKIIQSNTEKLFQFTSVV
eukprot:Tbor_TRINITY_DN2972_c0_g1::TRINITY_DN2972_c0_g1_i1::g.1071::m.1071/K03424/tatD; TatD DNase family protein